MANPLSNFFAQLFTEDPPAVLRPAKVTETQAIVSDFLEVANQVLAVIDPHQASYMVKIYMGREKYLETQKRLAKTVYGLLFSEAPLSQNGLVRAPYTPCNPKNAVEGDQTQTILNELEELMASDEIVKNPNQNLYHACRDISATLINPLLHQPKDDKEIASTNDRLWSNPLVIDVLETLFPGKILSVVERDLFELKKMQQEEEYFRQISEIQSRLEKIIEVCYSEYDSRAYISQCLGVPKKLFMQVAQQVVANIRGGDNIVNEVGRLDLPFYCLAKRPISTLWQKPSDDGNLPRL
jgi:hypothetical protein